MLKGAPGLPANRFGDQIGKKYMSEEAADAASRDAQSKLKNEEDFEPAFSRQCSSIN